MVPSFPTNNSEQLGCQLAEDSDGIHNDEYADDESYESDDRDENDENGDDQDHFCPDAVPKNSFDAMMQTLKGSTEGTNMSVQVMKKDPVTGSLYPAADREVDSLGTKTSIANSAKLLQNLSVAEKLEWALQVKSEGNDFYAKVGTSILAVCSH